MLFGGFLFIIELSREKGGCTIEGIREPSPAPDGARQAKTAVKDSVFRDLFEDRKYAFQLYQAIHPEDTAATEADIDSVTINNVFIDQEYNDLGMTVRGRLLLMLEAQSTWSINILIRILLYLTHTWNEIIETTRQNRYGTKKLSLPRPELYVIYTGSRKERPRSIRLSDEFFDGDGEFLEVKAEILYGEGKGDIISQYVAFTRVYNEQVKRYGRTQEAVQETIRLCKDQNVLKEYLESREKEVVHIMMSLFDQAKAMEQYGYEQRTEGFEEGKEKGIEQGVLKGSLETQKTNVLNMKNKGLPIDIIADFLSVDSNTIQQWLSESEAVQ